MCEHYSALLVYLQFATDFKLKSLSYLLFPLIFPLFEPLPTFFTLLTTHLPHKPPSSSSLLLSYLPPPTTHPPQTNPSFLNPTHPTHSHSIQLYSPHPPHPQLRSYHLHLPPTSTSNPPFHPTHHVINDDVEKGFSGVLDPGRNRLQLLVGLAQGRGRGARLRPRPRNAQLHYL